MRRALGRTGIAAFVALILASWPSTAGACSYALGFDASRKHCARAGAIPANAVVDGDELSELPDETRALFEEATELDARFAPCSLEGSVDSRCGGFFRLRPEASAGTNIRSREDWSCAVDYTNEAAPDVTPPATPVLADIVIGLKTDPAGTGCYSCPDVDTMTIFITNVSDERASRHEMYLVMYVGATEEEARTRTTIDHVVPAYEAGDVGVGPKRTLDPANGPAISVEAIVGESVDRARPIAEGVFAAGPRCVAVEMMDRAGNLSARSNAMCFDHTNESDPNVRAEDGSCACALHERPRASSFAIALFTIAALGVRLRRRR